MSAALKEHYSPEFVRTLALSLSRACPEVDAKTFLRLVLTPAWDGLALKERMHAVADAMAETLPGAFPRQLAVLLEAHGDFRGLCHLVFPDFVERHGQTHWEESMQALGVFTTGCSSEFAVRPFLKSRPEEGFRWLLAWTRSDNEHLRRLASEGSRPRLPWAAPLPMLIRDPSPCRPVLAALLDDPSPYVRRSVANHLNDISKDHPDLMHGWGRDWLRQRPARAALIRHAHRTLLKQAHPGALALFGFGDPDAYTLRGAKLNATTVSATAPLVFSGTLRGPPGRVRVDVVLHYRKANGTLSPKVFHLFEGDFDTEKSLQFRRSFRDLSTRRHYAGEHRLDLRVNGCVKRSMPFELTL